MRCSGKLTEYDKTPEILVFMKLRFANRPLCPVRGPVWSPVWSSVWGSVWDPVVFENDAVQKTAPRQEVPTAGIGHTFMKVIALLNTVWSPVRRPIRTTNGRNGAYAN